ncbi:MAG: PCRF domain-containing protein, partial [Pseudomonadota bacterium]
MRAETENQIAEIEKSLNLLRQRLGETAEFRLEELNAMSEDPELWNDPTRAQKLMRERQKLADALDAFNGYRQELADSQELIEMGEAEGDAEVVTEAEATIADLQIRAAQAEIEALLNGEADGNDTFLEINAGAGGTESCDWASILARMYVRWAEKRGYKVELMSQSAGEEAGIKSVTYQIKGENAYGWLKTESGEIRTRRCTP